LVGAVAGSFVAMGGAAALWPLVTSLSPHPGSPRDVVEVDLAGIGEGEWRTVGWRALPIVVRHRTAQEIEAARSIEIGALRDGFARVAGQPASLPAIDANRTRGEPRWLVVTGVCPRSGCIVEAKRPGDGFEPGIAWFCPCDACQFDTSGRVRKGLSLENLAVPLYRFLSPTRIMIGEA
jgi:ubiquinol-cytochrome c reductase iron-sulfur subunit